MATEGKWRDIPHSDEPQDPFKIIHLIEEDCPPLNGVQENWPDLYTYVAIVLVFAMFATLAMLD